MVEKILGALKALDIDTYYINETVSQSAEAFFIRKRLDLKRRTTLADYEVTVYRPVERNGEKLLGSSSLPVYPGTGEEELRQALLEAYHAASFAVNPRYELYAGQKADLAPSSSGFAGKPLEENLRFMAEALFSAGVQEDVFVNSAEIFANRKRNRVVNSAGVDVSWESCEVTGEYVVQCVAPADVETHHTFTYREPDADALREDVAASMAQTRDRARAVRSPKAGKYTVILSGRHVHCLLGYYLQRSSAAAIYQHYSDWSVGRAVQGDNVHGDPLTVILRAADPYDSEGIPLEDRVLMEDGVLRTVHGGNRFSRYLGVQPTGAYRSIQVPTGVTPLSEMKKAPYLHIVAFSDFQMNAMTGHFGGEIRLAYLFDGETVTPVTGGSVNGSILETQGDMVFSAERFKSAGYDGPLAVAIPGVAVAG